MSSTLALIFKVSYEDDDLNIIFYIFKVSVFSILQCFTILPSSDQVPVSTAWRREETYKDHGGKLLWIQNTIMGYIQSSLALQVTWSYVIDANTHIYIHKHKQTHANTHIHWNAHTLKHTYTFKYTHSSQTHSYTHIHTYWNTHTHNVHIHIETNTHFHTTLIATHTYKYTHTHIEAHT